MRLPFTRQREHERDNAPLPFQSYVDYFNFGGYQYGIGLTQTLTGNKVEVGGGFTGLALGAFQCDAVVFACEMVRLQHFSEARFQFRQMTQGRPGDLFGTADLAPLETPWTNGTTGDLLAAMLLHADLGGSAFVVRSGDRLNLLRPDWVTIVAGSPRGEGANVWDADVQIAGYIYVPGGPSSGNEPEVYLPSEIAHFAPIPDPLIKWRGMPWLRPVIDDITGDRAATEHKIKFYENGATPNMVVKLDISDVDKFNNWVEAFRGKYEGADNAYRTMFLGAGADPTVVGANFQQLDFKATTGVSETRIAAAAGTPPVIVGLSEGLQGSSLNEGNYTAARRRFADGTMRPLWRNAAGSLATVVKVPPGAALWYDDRDIAFLRDDAQQASEVRKNDASTMQILVNSGFEPDSAVRAVLAGDWNLLVHTGLTSVQLQPPGTDAAGTNGAASTNGAGAPAPVGT